MHTLCSFTSWDSPAQAWGGFPPTRPPTTPSLCVPGEDGEASGPWPCSIGISAETVLSPAQRDDGPGFPTPPQKLFLQRLLFLAWHLKAEVIRA